MYKAQEQVRNFHKVVVNAPTSPDEPKLRNPHLRASLILEEAIETAFALVGAVDAQSIVHDQLLKQLQVKADQSEPNLVEAIDGICDVIFVALGTAEDIGIELQPFWDEVCRSNLAKVGGPVDDNGKQGKPVDWTPPDIAGVLKKVYP